MKRIPGSNGDCELIVGTALDAFGQGAGHLGISPGAVESLRQQFISQIRSALEQPEWHENWQREHVYVIAYAKALGERAKAVAADDRRRIIMPEDVHDATAKLRGYLPIAGRWCPV
jgi:hypothetical protein